MELSLKEEHRMKRTLTKEHLLEINNLKVSFYVKDRYIQVVRGIDIQLNRGEIVGILGESGSGKTVASSSILRLIDNEIGRIDAGEIMFEGLDLMGLSEKRLNEIRGNRISYIFQNPSTALNPYKSIGKQLLGVMKTHKIPGSKEGIIRFLQEVGIHNAEIVYGMYPFQLSGGQNQRIMIAQSILCKPDIIIADEPTSSIDTSMQKTILDILGQINKKNLTTIVIITHDFDVAKYLCQRLIIMYGGLIVEEGSLEEVLQNPLHPYTKELISCARSLDTKEEKRYTLEGTPITPWEFREECPFFQRCKVRTEDCKLAIPKLVDRDGRKIRCVLFMKGSEMNA